MKTLLALLFAVTPYFAQARACHQVGWFNQGILVQALKSKSEELLNVEHLTVDQSSSTIRFKNINSSQWYSFTFKTCGYDIEFSETRQIVN